MFGIPFMRPGQRLGRERHLQAGGIGQERPDHQIAFLAFEKFTGGIFIKGAHEGIQLAQLLPLRLGHGRIFRRPLGVLGLDGIDDDGIGGQGLNDFNLGVHPGLHGGVGDIGAHARPGQGRQ